ncbi:hypothetical protein IEE94_11470 [Yimella sp. cx-573]|nr:hypothetical protein [Yimella sp. cx-573]
MTQAQRRATLAHELEHAERGDFFFADGVLEDERVVCRTASRRLIPLNLLVEAVRWSTNLSEVADELMVDKQTVKDRLRSLTREERQHLQNASTSGAWWAAP